MGLCSRKRIAIGREHGSVALVAHVIREAEAQERQRDPATFVLLPHQQKPVAAALDVDPAPQLGGEPLSYGAFLVERRHLICEKICQWAEML